jgi:hypothetical protein
LFGIVNYQLWRFHDEIFLNVQPAGSSIETVQTVLKSWLAWLSTSNKGLSALVPEYKG